MKQSSLINQEGERRFFFFIDASVNATHIQFGNLENRDSDPDPELTVVEHNVFKRLITN